MFLALDLVTLKTGWTVLLTKCANSIFPITQGTAAAWSTRTLWARVTQRSQLSSFRVAILWAQTPILIIVLLPRNALPINPQTSVAGLRSQRWSHKKTTVISQSSLMTSNTIARVSCWTAQWGISRLLWLKATKKRRFLLKLMVSLLLVSRALSALTTNNQLLPSALLPRRK